jgi:methylated-DNA-protein-cysteine methyltransferase-like protein
MGRVVGSGFRARVYERVRLVPTGQVSTYGDVATSLGSPNVARHVGWALAALDDDSVPWHRVINSRGTISFKGDSPRAVAQRARLEAEGVVFDLRGRVQLQALRFDFTDVLTDEADAWEAP